jgi:hypothetical protein
MVRVLALAALFASTGCYSPKPFANCELQCDPQAPAAEACPVGFACMPDHMCHSGSGPCVTADAGVPVAGVSCYGHGVGRTCIKDTTLGALVLDGQAIDTDSQVCTANVTLDGGTPSTERQVCVIPGTTVVFMNMNTAIGSRPLVVIAVESLEVQMGATLDVSNPNGTAMSAAGSTWSGCPVSTSLNGESKTATLQPGGGAGGTFHGRGGLGGLPGRGGAPPPNPLDLDYLHAGCAGGTGGNDGNGGSHAGPGRPGGVVYLIGKTITIDGTIDASGEHGEGATSLPGGGGGGGPGGWIGLDTIDATAIDIGPTANLVAGGGGGGGAANTTNAGSPGIDGDSTNATQGAAGGGSAVNNGGNGSSRTSANGLPGLGQLNNAGGGGGGGEGAITHVGGIAFTGAMPLIVPAAIPLP